MSIPNKLFRIDDRYFNVQVLDYLKHPLGKQLSFSCENYPHSVPMQARTHRIATFDCQSQRYSGERVMKIENISQLEDVFYLRPVGKYRDRQGNKVDFTPELRDMCLVNMMSAVKLFQNLRIKGMPEESARDVLPQGIRQNFVVSFTLDQFFHFCDLRAKKDAQIEIQDLTNRMLLVTHEIFPDEVDSYFSTRYLKAKLEP